MKRSLPLILVVLMLCACGAKPETQEEKISRIDQEETYPDVPGTLAVVYPSLEELAKDAQLIVVGKPGAVEERGMFVRTAFEVEQVLKGEAEEEQITVLEGKGNEKTVMGGIPWLSEEHTYCLMLQQAEEGYVVCGAFQGRFILREGYYFQQAIQGVKLAEYSPAVEMDFEGMIRDSLS